MFIKELASSSAKMGVIAKNKEDYITFLITIEVDKYIDKNGEECSKEIELRFIDSFKFMSSSLDSLVNSDIPMNIWMIGINLKKLFFLLRKISIVNSTCLGLATKIMNTLAEFGTSLGSIT